MKTRLLGFRRLLKLQMSGFAANISMLVATLLMLAPKMVGGTTLEELPVSSDIFKSNPPPPKKRLLFLFFFFSIFPSFVESCP